MNRLDAVPMPKGIEALPKDDRGFPVPWFVAWINGEPDFRVIGENKIQQAYKHRKCWLCGCPLGFKAAFVIGPMCAINRVSSEPPSHPECADYAAKVCPFLTKPAMKRNEKDLPNHKEAAGMGLKRNPGCCLVWVTRTNGYKAFNAPGGGVLFNVGSPLELRWYAEGRLATRAEIMSSIDSGLPLLQDGCFDQHDRDKLASMHEAALLLVPDGVNELAAAARRRETHEPTGGASH